MKTDLNKELLSAISDTIALLGGNEEIVSIIRKDSINTNDIETIKSFNCLINTKVKDSIVELNSRLSL